MRTTLSTHKHLGFYTPALIAVAFAALTLSSCATKYPTQPATPTTTNSVTVDEFFTLPPNGEADDFYFLSDTEDDVDYSFFLDDQDYENALHDVNTGDTTDVHYRFIIRYVKNGHGYGDHNHIHEFVKGSKHDHGDYIGDEGHEDWTDSIALTDLEKSEIDTAMISFLDCARPAIDTFATKLAPYRDTFRVQREAIVLDMDSGKITRDSARIELDTVIVRYQAATLPIRTAFFNDLATCRTELDLTVKLILTPTQYAIWVRHRGW